MVLMTILVFFSGKKINDTYQIGDLVKDFELKNVDGNFISMADQPKNAGYILVFTCNTCPWAKGYEQRIIDLHNKYMAKGYPVIAIQPNDEQLQPGDSFEEMKKRSDEMEYPFPYVIDQTQEVTLAFGARATPQVYLVQKESNGYYLRYIGGIDNSPRDGSKATEKWAEDAVDQLLQGKEVSNTHTKAIGCSIKWSKESKERMAKN